MLLHVGPGMAAGMDKDIEFSEEMFLGRVIRNADADLAASQLAMNVDTVRSR